MFLWNTDKRDTRVAGHWGKRSTQELVSRDFTWDRWREDRCICRILAANERRGPVIENGHVLGGNALAHGLAIGIAPAREYKIKKKQKDASEEEERREWQQSTRKDWMVFRGWLLGMQRELEANMMPLKKRNRECGNSRPEG